MAIAFIGAGISAGSTGGSNVTTGSYDTTGANFLVACITSNLTTATLTDSKSNTWTALTNSVSTVSCRLFYSFNPTVGSGQTFTTVASGNFPSIGVMAFSGVQIVSDPFDQQNGGVNAAGTTVQPGSITPGQDHELIISGFGANVGTAYSIDASMTETLQVNFSSGNHFGLCFAYAVQTSLAAINPTWTNGSSGALASRIASFKALAGFMPSKPFIVRQAVNRASTY